MRRVIIATATAALVLAAFVPGSVPANAQEPAPEFTEFIGALHEHSGYSDGWPGSVPSDYFASAKGFGLDFLGSGEHSDSADVPMVVSDGCLTPAIADCAVADQGQPANSLRKWDATKEQAQAATDENFTAFRGFEWTSDRFGHINVYFSRNDTNAKADGGYGDMAAFWNWFTTAPYLGGGSDGLATFNHPGDKSLSEDDSGFNWNDFLYVEAADERMVGLEVFNGDKDFVAGGWYTRALDKGWHVGAVGAEDKGHDASDRWGGPEWAKTVLLARDRSEAALREAMLNRRMYAVLDNAARLTFTADGQPMGSRIGNDVGEPVTLVADTNLDAATVSIVTNGGAVLASQVVSNAVHDDQLTIDVPTTAEEQYYFVTVTDSSGKAVAYSSPVWVAEGGGPAPRGEWVAGDFHVHTPYSHDSYDPVSDDNTGPDEFYTAGLSVDQQFRIASTRGLDFLTISDHNDVRSQSAPGFGGYGVFGVGAYENSLNGHAQMIGAHQVYDNGDKSVAAVNSLASILRAAGGAFQINHPAEGATGEELDWKYGYDVEPDTVEVWNISRAYQPPFPSASNNDVAIEYWEGWLDRGVNAAATGGSDTHWITTGAAQGVGSPTTWVYVTERSERGIVEGLRAGRTFVSHTHPSYGGPTLILDADIDDDGEFESMMGDTVPAGTRLRVSAYGPAAAGLAIYTSNGPLFDTPVSSTGPDFGMSFTVEDDVKWVRAELLAPDAQEERRNCDGPFGGQTTYCRNKIAVLAMTSAIFLEPPQ